MFSGGQPTYNNVYQYQSLQVSQIFIVKLWDDKFRVIFLTAHPHPQFLYQKENRQPLYYLNSLGGENTLLLAPPRGANKHFPYSMREINSLYCIHSMKHWLRWILALWQLKPSRVLKGKFHFNIYFNGLFLVLCSLRACRVIFQILEHLFRLCCLKAFLDLKVWAK